MPVPHERSEHTMAAALVAALAGAASCNDSWAAERGDLGGEVVRQDQPRGAHLAEPSTLPATLVGRWSNTYQVNLTYEFFADGRYIYVGILPAPPPCLVVGGYRITRRGVALTRDGFLILMPSAGTAARVDCSGNVTPVEPNLAVEQHRFFIDTVEGRPVLHLLDENGVEVQYSRPRQ